ncbi:hypothetical protein D3C75_919810 [compost metagenome]
MLSPTRRLPAATLPAKPRKSRFGRFTHCTGMRNGARLARLSSSGALSRCSSRLGPWYQGMLALRSSRLSPLSAESGMQWMSVSPSLAAKARYSASISWNTVSE